MKLRSILLVSALGVAGAAHAVTLANFTFEGSSVSTTGTNAGPYAAESGSGAASGHHAASATYNNVAGNGSAKSFSSNTWAVGDYYQFTTSTLGTKNVMLSFDQTSSGTGPRDFKVQYSLTATGAYTDLTGGSYVVLANGASPNASWSANATTPGRQTAYSLSFNLSSVTALNNQAAIFLRLTDGSTVSANGGAVGTGGTSRVDNVTISASAVPEPTTVAALGLGLVAVLRRRRSAK